MHDVGPADPFGIPGLTKDDLKKASVACLGRFVPSNLSYRWILLISTWSVILIGKSWVWKTWWGVSWLCSHFGPDPRFLKEDEEMCVEMLDDQLTRALKEAAEYPANLAQGQCLCSVGPFSLHWRFVLLGDFKQADYADLAEEDEGDGDSETPSQNRENMPDRND